MRMIDADMLADGLKLHRQSTDQKHETDRQWAVGYNAGLERALYSISYAPTLTPPNEWVSVEERLPEPGERVLATDCGFVGEFYINKRGQWQRYNVNCSELLMALDILYWMPLPKSPKEDE